MSVTIRRRRSRLSAEVPLPPDTPISTSRVHIPWARIGLEFLAIFAAVLLSFIAEDWRQHRGDRRAEAQLIRGLLEDLNIDDTFYRLGTIPTDSIAVAAGEWLQANWTRQNPPADSIDWALNGLYRGMVYAPARTEYEGARGSARLDLLQSPSLRRQISMYFEQSHAILEEVWSLNLRFSFDWTEASRPYVQFAPTFRGPVIMTIPEAIKQDLYPVARLAVPWHTFQQDRQAYFALAQTNTFRRLILAYQRRNLKEIHSLQQALERDLNT